MSPPRVTIPLEFFMVLITVPWLSKNYNCLPPFGAPLKSESLASLDKVHQVTRSTPFTGGGPKRIRRFYVSLRNHILGPFESAAASCRPLLRLDLTSKSERNLARILSRPSPPSSSGVVVDAKKKSTLGACDSKARFQEYYLTFFLSDQCTGSGGGWRWSVHNVLRLSKKALVHFYHRPVGSPSGQHNQQSLSCVPPPK